MEVPNPLRNPLKPTEKSYIYKKLKGLSDPNEYKKNLIISYLDSDEVLKAKVDFEDKEFMVAIDFRGFVQTLKSVFY